MQPIEVLSNIEIFLKVARSATFKNISGFLLSAERCNDVVDKQINS